jgi:MafB19-like deaminase
MDWSSPLSYLEVAGSFAPLIGAGARQLGKIGVVENAIAKATAVGENIWNSASSKLGKLNQAAGDLLSDGRNAWNKLGSEYALVDGFLQPGYAGKTFTQQVSDGFQHSLASIKGSILDPWDAIDRLRGKVNGLRELGDSIPKIGDKNGTVAITMNGESLVFGVNSKLLSEQAKQLGKDFHEIAKSQGFFQRGQKYNWGTAQVFTHAEAHSLMRAYRRSGGKLAEEVTMYVDRTSCGNCQNQLAVIMEVLGVKKLNVIAKNSLGNITYENIGLGEYSRIYKGKERILDINSVLENGKPFS